VENSGTVPNRPASVKRQPATVIIIPGPATPDPE